MEKPEFIENGIKVRALGDLSGLPEDVREGFIDIEDTTAEFTTLVLNIAVNYGSRQEIINAARSLAQKPLAVRSMPVVSQKRIFMTISILKTSLILIS